MADPRLIIGKIIAVEGATPGPASRISYTIAVHDPNVDGIFTLTRQTPMKRLPDTLDVDAYIVGDIVVGSVEANRVRWHFQELPAFADCPTLTPPSPIVSPTDSLTIPPITPYATSTKADIGASSSLVAVADLPSTPLD